MGNTRWLLVSMLASTVASAETNHIVVASDGLTTGAIELGRDTLLVETTTSWARGELGGPISGDGDVLVRGPGVVDLTCSLGANTFAGGLVVQSAVHLQCPPGRIAAPGSVTVANGALLYLDAPDQLGPRAQIEDDGTLFADGSVGEGDETVAALSGSGALSIGPYTWTVGGTNEDSTFSGSARMTTGQLDKVGTGTFTLDGEVDGTLTLSAGTLSGSGLIGSLHTEGGRLAPGDDGPGTITVGDVTLGAHSVLEVELAGGVAGVDYDQLQAWFGVTLEGELDIVVNGTFAPGDRFTIVHNTSRAKTEGTFLGLDEGDTISARGTTFAISYVGGDGNDVTLTVVPSPPAESLR